MFGLDQKLSLESFLLWLVKIFAIDLLKQMFLSKVELYS